MLQPKKPQDNELNSIVQNMIDANESEENIALVIKEYAPLKKKAGVQPSLSNAPIQGAASGQKVGSLDGKATKGFPKVDTNSVAPGDGVQPRAETAISPIKKAEKKAVVAPVDKEYDFIDSLVDNLDSGIATISKSFYDAPALVYDVAASLSNPLVEVLGGKANRSEDFAKTFGLRNVPAEVLKGKIDRTNKDIQDYNDKNGGNAFEAVSNGNYLGAAKMIAGTTMQSLPLMSAAMATGGSTASMIAIGGSSASTKAAQLKDENPEMDVATRTTNAAFSGLLEAYVGHLINGASGAVVKKIIADKGTEVGSKLISKSIKSVIEKNIEKNPLIGLFGEVAEESVVELGNQASDMASGIRTEFDIKAIANAGLSATGMGGINTVAVYGAKGYVKAVDYKKAKAVNKEISKLSNELSNDKLSDADKEILKSKIVRLSDSNKKLIKDSVEKADALPITVKEELGTIESSIDNLKGQILDIQDNADMSDDTKQALITEIKEQGRELIARKNKVIDGNYIYDDFEKLSQKEKNKFKDEAGRLLLAEAQKGGKENASFEDAELSKKAAELHNESLKQEAKAQIKAEQQAVVDTPSQVVTPTQEVENLRAQEQVELQDAIPNIDDYKVDGKVDEIKITDVQDKQKFEEIYDKYDKLITPLLEQQNEATPPTNSVFDDVSLSNDIGIDRNSIPLDGKSESVDLGVIVATNGDKLSISAEEINLSYPGKKKFVRKITAENTVDGSKAILSFSIDNGKLIIKHVESDKKGSGYGTDLINKAIDEAKKQGITEVVADDVESLQSEEYWNKIGFKQDPDSRSNRILDISEPNEKTPSTDTPANGNVQLGTPIVEQDGKQEIDNSQNIQEPVDGGKSKGDVEVDKEYQDAVSEKFAQAKPLELDLFADKSQLEDLIVDKAKTDKEARKMMATHERIRKTIDVLNKLKDCV